ncbi:hypothetical protein [Pseudonocardia endophytica]|uniref:Uncharacterized protein n=1 Tax=Pseudonocardia endophytica TaxID=401976 RepID=A0A4R1HPE7_PSEEN|nr:hypothetical protein [Pseudonocardia endophytica]TCK22270.1 hypothetical protein EV378_6271 [Pseudonocardia endophytica]
MSDHPTRAARPDRPLWGPVRRPGEVTPPGPLDAPTAEPDAATPAGPPSTGPDMPGASPWSGPEGPAASPWSGQQAQGAPWSSPEVPGASPGTVAAGVAALPAPDTAAAPGWAPAPGAPDGPAMFGGPATGNPYAGTLGGDLYGPATPSHPLSSPFTETRQRPTVPPQWTGPDRTHATPPPTVPPAPATPAAAGEWSRTRLIAVGITCAVALLVAGSGVVWAMNRVPGPAADAASVGQDPVSPASVAPAPASTQAAPDPTVRSGSGLVQVDAAAASNPLAQPVADLLDRHFTSINTLDYPTWTSTVSSRRAADQTADRWRSDYRSTRDGDVHVTSISDDGSGAATVGLRFTSQQDVADAPSDLSVGKICWSSRWPITGLPSAGTIGTAPKGTTTKQAC